MGGDDPCASGVPGLECSLDFIGIAYHGLASTHIDALCHVFVDRLMYNGIPAEEVRSTGARRNSIMCAKDGIAGRAVLLDIPKLRKVPCLNPLEPVHVAELAAAEAAQNVKVGEGDILLVSVGRDSHREHEPPKPGKSSPLGGLHPDCIPWLFERKIAVLGADGVQDPVPSPAQSKTGPFRFTCAASSRWACICWTISISSIWKKRAPKRNVGNFSSRLRRCALRKAPARRSIRSQSSERGRNSKLEDGRIISGRFAFALHMNSAPICFKTNVRKPCREIEHVL